MSTFEGIWTALWTPTDHSGKLLKSAIRNQIDFLKRGGVQGIVVGGSTGEFVRMTLQQRHELLDCVIEHSATLPLIVNISDSVFENVNELASHARKGCAAGVLVLPPSYYAISQDDIMAYFLAVSEHSQDLPFLLYNFPACVRNGIEVETISSLAEKMPLAGIKHSGSNFDYLEALLELKFKKPFSVLTGADSRLPEVMRMGIKGSIGGLSNAIPELIVEVFKKTKENKNVEKEQSKIKEIAALISQLDFPYDVAAAMQARGLEVGASKVPRSIKNLELQEKIAAELVLCLKSFCRYF